jgi:hypothetical protein
VPKIVTPEQHYSREQHYDMITSNKNLEKPLALSRPLALSVVIFKFLPNVIPTSTDGAENTREYQRIPENDKSCFDLLLGVSVSPKLSYPQIRTHGFRLWTLDGFIYSHKVQTRITKL